MAKIGILKIGTFNEEGSPNNDWLFVGKKSRNGAMHGWDIRDLQALKAKADAGEIAFEYEETNAQFGECLEVTTVEDADEEASKKEAPKTDDSKAVDIEFSLELYKFAAEITGIKGTDKGVEVKLLTPDVDTAILKRVGFECDVAIVIKPLGFGNISGKKNDDGQGQLFNENGEVKVDSEPVIDTTEKVDTGAEEKQQSGESDAPKELIDDYSAPEYDSCPDCGTTMVEEVGDPNGQRCPKCKVFCNKPLRKV
jgi:hypothetical protein